MKVEFNDNSYNIGNMVGRSACGGCIIMEESLNLKCPTDSEGECILPLNKIYINGNLYQIFKL